MILDTCKNVEFNEQKALKDFSTQNQDQIRIKEIDNKYTQANLKREKCTVKSCSNNATHWLTRQNSEYCQSDMICNHHASIWMQVKNLLAQT